MAEFKRRLSQYPSWKSRDKKSVSSKRAYLSTRGSSMVSLLFVLSVPRAYLF